MKQTNMMKLIGVVGVTTATAFIWAGEAKAIITANTTTFDDTNGIIEQEATTGTVTPNDSNQYQFDKFDTSLGTLDGITVETFIEVTDGGSYQVDNESDSAVTIDIDADYEGSLEAGDLDGDQNLDPNEVRFDTGFGADNTEELTKKLVNADGVTLQQDDGDSDNQVDNDGGNDFASFTGNTGDGNQSRTLASDVFDDYKGSSGDTFLLDIIQSQSLELSSSSGISQGSSPGDTSQTTTITYNYTPDSEPVPFEAETSLAFVFLGAFGAWKYWKRRKQQQVSLDNSEV